MHWHLVSFFSVRDESYTIFLKKMKNISCRIRKLVLILVEFDLLTEKKHTGIGRIELYVF